MKKKILTSLSPLFYLSNNVVENDIFHDCAEEFVDNLFNEGNFTDPVYGECNMKKALKQRNKEMENEYEAFDKMHIVDGTFSKSKFSL